MDYQSQLSSVKQADRHHVLEVNHELKRSGSVCYDAVLASALHSDCPMAARSQKTARTKKGMASFFVQLGHARVASSW